MSLQDVRVGARYYDNGGGPFETGYINADISEVLVYGSLLSPGERMSVEQSLMAKYFPSAPAVPEPGNMALLVGMATVGTGLWTRKRRR